MPYAEGRANRDADSHIMETRNWLAPCTDPKTRPLLRPFDPDLEQHLIFSSFVQFHFASSFYRVSP